MSEQLHALNELYDTTRQEKVIMAVREAQGLIDDCDALEPEELSGLIADLNMAWPHRFDAMRLYGKALLFCDSDSYFENDELYPSEDEFIEQTFSGLPVTSHGFIVTDRPVYVAGEQVSVRHEIMYKVALENKDGEWVDGFGSVEQAVLVPYSPAQDMLTAEARYFLPDEVADIDMAILNAENEVEAVKALRYVRFTPSPSLLDNGMTTDEYVNRLAVYANQLITFDKRVPYRMTLEGNCRLYSEGSGDVAIDLQDMPRERRLGYPETLTVEPIGEGEYGFSLTVSILFNNYTENKVSLPLSSLRGFVSLRLQELGRIANGVL